MTSAVPDRLMRRRRATAPDQRRQDGAHERGRQRERQGTGVLLPPIETKYGRPVGEWLELVRSSPLQEHMDVVAWLKTEHGLGHGHADALVAHVRAEAAKD